MLVSLFISYLHAHAHAYAQAIETKDIVVKKMVYLYLCNYAHKEPDMAIMCINSLRRDWYVLNLFYTLLINFHM